MLSLRQALKCSGSNTPSVQGMREALGLHRGEIRLRRRSFPLTLIAYNTALLHTGFYMDSFGELVHEIERRERQKKKNTRAFIQYILESDADIIALGEVFDDDERDSIKKAVEGHYSTIRGPKSVRDDITFKGSGLLLLTRLPVIDEHRFAFSHVAGGVGEGDEWAAKGVLHVRVKLDDGRHTPCDICLTHTQSEYGHARASTWRALRAQLSDVGWFTLANRNSHWPAFIVGDLNVDGGNSEKYAEMMERLHHPVDLWKAMHEDAPGFTFADGNTFKGSPRSGGKRLDYALQHAGARLIPLPSSVDILRWRRGDRDISDHFGLRVVYEEALEIVPSVDGSIRAVEARIRRLRALRETASDGWGYLHDSHESDEVKLTLKLRDAHGREDKTKTSRSGIDTGETVEPKSHASARLPHDPGAHIDVHLRGKEIDDITSDDNMGSSSLRISREDLLLSGGKPIQRVMPRLARAGGDYAVEIEIRAE